MYSVFRQNCQRSGWTIIASERMWSFSGELHVTGVNILNEKDKTINSPSLRFSYIRKHRLSKWSKKKEEFACPLHIECVSVVAPIKRALQGVSNRGEYEKWSRF